MYTLSKLAASKVKVVLSGQGADEPLGGYKKYKALPALDYLVKATALQPLFAMAARSLKNQNLRRILSSAAISDRLYSFFEFNSLFGDFNFRKFLNPKNAESVLSKYDEVVGNIHDDLAAREFLPTVPSDLFTYLDTRTKLPETLLKYTDKITMHFGLECRVPMLDNDLVAFIESIPRKHKYNFNNSKIIHKAFAEEYLPSEMIHRKKLAFHGPSKGYIRSNSKLIKEWLLQNNNHLFWQIFSKQEIIKLVDEHELYANREKELILVISMLMLTAEKNKKYVPELISSGY